MGQYYTPFISPVTKLTTPNETEELITPELKQNVKDKNFTTFYCFDFDCGAKLMESSWIGNEYVNAVLSHIHNNPMVVAWLGDYSADVPFMGDVDEDGNEMPCEIKYGIYASRMTKEEFEQIYVPAMECETHGKAASDDYKTLLTHETKGMFLVNHTQKLFVNMEEYISQNTYDGGWCINPLPLLTACGNGQGGGDYCKNGCCYEMVGDWAFNVIEYTATVPDGYEQTIVNFAE